MLPSFIIIGTMKAGTTSLFKYLESNPEIGGSLVKETDFFIEKKNFGKGTDWYSSLFPDSPHKAFEASPNYTKRHLHPGVPKRLSALLPHVKLIYVVRDPVARIISHYIHSVAAGLECRDLSEAIQDPQSNYIQTSRYYYQISAFLDYFDHNRIHVVQSERLGKNPEFELSKIARFLDIPDSFDKKTIVERHHSSDNKRRPSVVEFKMLRLSTRPTWKRLVRFALQPMRRPFVYPKLEAQDSELLKSHLQEDINMFRRFAKMDFEDWTV